LPRAAAIRAGLGICPRFAANATARRTELDAGNLNLFTAAECRLLEGKSEVTLQAVPLLGNSLSSLPEDGAESIPERFENIPEPAEAKIRKTTLPIYPAIAVISVSFLRVGENLVSLVYFFEFLLGSWLSVAIRMVLEGQLAKCPLDFLITGISRHSQHFVVVLFYRHNL
jgi:hypothetical protein